MANYSDTYIEIYGKRETIRQIKKQLQELTKNGHMDFSEFPGDDYNGFEIYDMLNNGDSLIINGTGRWSAPYDFFKERIFEKYEVNANFIDTEGGSDFFFKATFEKGKTIEEIETEYFSKESVEEFGLDSWYEDRAPHFEDAGKNWREECADIIKVFNDAGVSTEELEKIYHLKEKNILFVVGRSGTGKTTLGNALTEKSNAIAFDPIKSLTTKKMRSEADLKWYQPTGRKDLEKMPPYELIEREEFGGELYATTENMIFDSDSINMVKAIEPKGLNKMLNFLKNCPNTRTGIILMDIDKKQVIENLKRDGFNADEISERLSRGDEKADLYELGIEPDLVITELDDQVVAKVNDFARVHFADEQPTLNKELLFRQALDQSANNNKFPEIVLAP